MQLIIHSKKQKKLMRCAVWCPFYPVACAKCSKSKKPLKTS